MIATPTAPRSSRRQLLARLLCHGTLANTMIATSTAPPRGGSRCLLCALSISSCRPVTVGCCCRPAHRTCVSRVHPPLHHPLFCTRPSPHPPLFFGHNHQSASYHPHNVTIKLHLLHCNPESNAPGPHFFLAVPLFMSSHIFGHPLKVGPLSFLAF